MKSQQSPAEAGDDDDDFLAASSYTGLWWLVIFLMLASFFWTNQVIGNTVRTTVAGCVGTFWFVPEEAIGCYSPALSSSLFRSLTYSFGSICFGSLIAAAIQALRQLAKYAEQELRVGGSRRESAALLMCLIQCLLSVLEEAAEYFNKWAFLYVGIYGYGYLEAGKNVLTLFRERGWTAIINDNLTARVLGLLSFAIGLMTGLVAAAVGALVNAASSSSVNGSGLAAGSFLFGLLLGWIVASIVLTVVNSAADTIVILFAEAPAEFQKNHPELAAEMNRAWSTAFPNVFNAAAAAPTLVV